MPERDDLDHPGGNQRNVLRLRAGGGGKRAHLRGIPGIEDEPVDSLFQDTPVERDIGGRPGHDQDPAPPGHEVLEGDDLPVPREDDPRRVRGGAGDPRFVFLPLHPGHPEVGPFAQVPLGARRHDATQFPGGRGAAVRHPKRLHPRFDGGDRHFLVPRDDPGNEPGKAQVAPQFMNTALHRERRCAASGKAHD